jgi:methionine sulfoxide reductase heme-binding subunit
VTRLQSAARIATITVIAAVASGLIGLTSNRHGIPAWSIGTAYSAFFLVAYALVLGPINVIRGNPNPVHSALRRDVGISAGLMSIAHTVIGLQVHMGGDLSRYFFRQGGPPRLDGSVFLAANWMGLLSAVIFGCVTVVSNDPSLRALGLKTWKGAQRCVYPAMALAVLHGFGYQALEKRFRPAVALVAIVVVLVLGLQIAGMREMRRKTRLRSI